MCGRFVCATPLTELAERFLVEEVRAEALPASYNVAPTDAVYAVAEHDGRRLLGTFRWGLVPPGARDPAFGRKLRRVDKPDRNAKYFIEVKFQAPDAFITLSHDCE
jgi:putative SOS response-associated peptidase YedK